ncbi:hypothetical protein DRO24_04975 [Candidatus Bathyarchaeota archaeon]|nr:MAG: hypothetical protein DRO24_04975 [Candidatus Bathyarchaeota archaeon]
MSEELTEIEKRIRDSVEDLFKPLLNWSSKLVEWSEQTVEYCEKLENKLESEAIVSIWDLRFIGVHLSRLAIIQQHLAILQHKILTEFKEAVIYLAYLSIYWNIKSNEIIMPVLGEKFKTIEELIDKIVMKIKMLEKRREKIELEVEENIKEALEEFLKWRESLRKAQRKYIM